MQKKKVVILGGGNGGSISIRAMKQYIDQYDISAVIAMSDSGSSSGQLRRELGVLPPGDILRAVLAMSRYDYDLLKRIFYDTRYSEKGKLQGFGVGHLFIGLVEKYNGGIVDAVRALAQALDVVGPVFPVTLESADLVAELQDKTLIVGEHEIDRPVGSKDNRIVTCSLQPNPQGYDRALKEIREADVLLIGPGSFYTSIIATVLPVGVKEAIAQSHAKIVFVSGNAVERDGELGPTSLSGFVEALEASLPRPLDVVVYNRSVLTQNQQMFYDKKGWVPFVDDAYRVIRPCIAENYEKEEGGLDPVKLGNIIHTYITSIV
jgi:uncharacterized cofD-like protein